VYTAVFGSWTDHTRPCTRAVKTAVYTVHGPCTAMYTVRTRSGKGRVPNRVLPRTGCVHGRVHDHGRTMYVARVRPRASVHSLYTAAHSRVQTVYTPCTGHVHGPSVIVHTAVFTARVHGGVPTVYNGRVYGRSRRVRTVYTGVQRPCT